MIREMTSLHRKGTPSTAAQADFARNEHPINFQWTLKGMQHEYRYIRIKKYHRR